MLPSQRGEDLKEIAHRVIGHSQARRYVVWTVEGHKTLAQRCCFRDRDARPIVSRHRLCTR